jgi:hypothetical protein
MVILVLKAGLRADPANAPEQREVLPAREDFVKVMGELYDQYETDLVLGRVTFFVKDR